MLAYISLAACSTREQEFLASDRIGTFAYEYAHDLINSTQGLTHDILLTGSRYPFLQKNNTIPFLELPPLRDDFLGERQRISKRMHDTAVWRVIVRPMRGRISLTRLRLLCEHLALLESPETENEQCKIIYVSSVVPYQTLAHPLWNLRAVRHDKGSGTSVRFSCFGTSFEKNETTLFAALPSDGACPFPAGSQQVQDLYYDDGALCAFRSNWDFESCAPFPVPHPVFTPPGAYLESLPDFFQLPAFDMDPWSPIDCTTLEKLLSSDLKEKHKG